MCLGGGAVACRPYALAPPLQAGARKWHTYLSSYGARPPSIALHLTLCSIHAAAQSLCFTLSHRWQCCGGCAQHLPGGLCHARMPGSREQLAMAEFADALLVGGCAGVGRELAGSELAFRHSGDVLPAGAGRWALVGREGGGLWGEGPTYTCPAGCLFFTSTAHACICKLGRGTSRVA